MIWASCAAAHGVELPLQPSDVAVLASATLPAPAAIAIGVASVRSGAGRSGAGRAARLLDEVVLAGRDRLTFGSSVSCVGVAPKLPVPVALAYWIDQPFRLIGAVVGLKSST